MLSVYALTQEFKVEHGKLTIACDNAPAVAQCKWSGRISASQPEYNIIKAIRALKKRSTVTYDFIHVKGHQDDFPGVILDDWAQMNFLMDTTAKDYWQRNTTLGDALWDKPWRLQIQGRHATANVILLLREACASPDAIQYWKTKNCHQFTYTNLQITRDIMLALPPHRRRWLSKHAAGVCGVKQCLLRWRQSDTDKCPRCNEVETAQHVWVCKGHSASAAWDHALKTFESELLEIQTSPDIIQTIISNLTSWRDGYTNDEHTDNIIDTAVAHQATLGWHALLEGRVAYSWCLPQAKYLQSLGSGRSERRWLILLAKKAVQVAWDLWQHRNKVEHNVRKNERHQAIFQEVNRLLQLDWQHNSESRALLNKVRNLNENERISAPKDFLLRWCQRLHIFERQQAQ